MKSNNLDWRKSSRCHISGECLEVAAADGAVLLRRTRKDGSVDGNVMRLSLAEWNAFTLAVKEDEFRDLTDTI